MTSDANATYDDAAAGSRRRALRSVWFLAAVAAYVLVRTQIYNEWVPHYTDVRGYFGYAVVGVDHGWRPYRDIADLEYPPVAYWLICLPRAASGDRFTADAVPLEIYDAQYERYHRRFRGLMLGGDVASFALFCAIVLRRRPERLAWAAWGYVLSTACLFYVLLDRLDVGVTLSILIWAYCTLRSDDSPRRAWLWTTVGYAALGLGVSFKLIPLIAAPFALWADVCALRRRPRDWRRLLGPAVLAVAAVGPFAYYYVEIGSDLQRLFNYHQIRGLEIESTAASLMMLFESADQLEPYFDFGSWNLRSPWEQTLLTLSNGVLSASLVLLGLRALAAPRIDGRFDGAAAYRYACVAIPTALVAAKVFSVQYLLWGLPLLILAGVEVPRERRFRGLVGGAVLSAALTCGFYPHYFYDGMIVEPYSSTSPPRWSLVNDQREIKVGDKTEYVAELSDGGPPVPSLIARNLVFAVCTAIAAWSLVRRREGYSQRTTKSPVST